MHSISPLSRRATQQDFAITRRTLLAAAASAAAVAAVPAGQRAVVAQSSDVLIIGTDADAPLFDHLRSTTSPAATLLVFENLAIRLEDSSWAPWVAESWEEMEDGRGVTFKIREGLKFHDDTPLDAEAVKWFFDMARDPEGEHAFSSSYSPVSDITVEDPLTVSFHFSEPFTGFFDTVSGSFAGLISPTAYESAGEDYGVSVAVGSGPYKFDEWVPQDRMNLSRFEDYNWAPMDFAENEGPALIPQIEFRIYAEPATAIAALETDQIQILHGMSVQDYQRMEGDPNYAFVTRPRSGGALIYASFNLDREPLQELAVRQALNAAIDKEGVANAVFRNIGGIAAYGHLPPHFPAAYPDPQSIGYPYDIDRANSLLDEAGWELVDGVRQKDGVSLAFEMLCNNETNFSTTAQIVQSNFEEIGVDLTVTPMTNSARLEQVAAGDFDINLGRWGWSRPDILNFFFPSTAANNWTNINDPELDQMLEEATGAPTLEELEQGFQDAEVYLIEQAYWAPIIFQTDLIGLRSNVQGYSFNELGDRTFPTDWSLED